MNAANNLVEHVTNCTPVSCQMLSTCITSAIMADDKVPVGCLPNAKVVVWMQTVLYFAAALLGFFITIPMGILLVSLILTREVFNMVHKYYDVCAAVKLNSINLSICSCSKCPEIHIKGFSIASRTTRLRPALTAAQLINYTMKEKENSTCTK